ncbi:MAG: SIMPL domain-containing protein, partial [Actinobacteria bacterium]|nr:SIMPL domain-containing protein [Actinomycetota bacterium]
MDPEIEEDAMSTRAWAGGGAAAAIVAATLVSTLVTAAAGQDAVPAGGPPHTITVSSAATIGTRPDEAVIGFSVHTDSPDSTVALKENSRIMNDVIAAMKSSGITERDMETTNLNVSPRTIDRGTPS